MLEPDFVEHLGEHVDETNQLLSMYGASMVNPVPVLEDYQRYAARIAPHVADTSAEVGAAHIGNRRAAALFCRATPGCS